MSALKNLPADDRMPHRAGIVEEPCPAIEQEPEPESDKYERLYPSGENPSCVTGYAVGFPRCGGHRHGARQTNIDRRA